jgi:hypothetical protein
MRDISRASLLEAELSGPTPEGDADLFGSDRGFQVLLREIDGFPVLEIRGADGDPVRVVDEEGGTRLDDEEVSVPLWERLERFDAVIERLAGPFPDPQL